MNAPERVLMTADTIGGVWTYALELCGELFRRSIRVTLATMGRAPSDGQRAEARALQNVTLVESEFRLEWMDDPWDDQGKAGEWLLDLEAHDKPDVVHLNSYALAALPWRSPTLVVGHSCVLSWWRAVRGGEAPSEWQRYKDAVARGLAAAGILVCPTRAMLDALRECYGAAAGRSRVIPNGRDPSRFQPGSKEDFVLAAGRLWDEAKNIRALDRIAPRLGWPVLVAGEEEHPEGGRAEMSGVRFLGRLGPDELARYYARAAIYALPALYEPFGLTALEAALAGCALVLGDIPSLRENWDGAAAFVDPADPDDLARRLETLIRDRALRLELASKARSRARRFSAAHMGRDYVETYRELIETADSMRKAARCA